jgi:hypothetical protein
VANLAESLYSFVAERMLAGKVVPFLGAGASLSPRRAADGWLGKDLPSGYELTRELARVGKYPDDTANDLLRVSQYVDARWGEGFLYSELRNIFARNYPILALHRLLASLPPLLRERGAKQQLIITTNYDDLLERAFDKRGEPYDLVWYDARQLSPTVGRFIHRPPGGDPIPIDFPNEYDALSLEHRTVILKLHGAVQRVAENDSFVITEDSYIAYLTHYDVSAQMPIALPILLREHMAESHFLFLGYSLRDWNLRVVLTRVWGTRKFNFASWAVQRKPRHDLPEQNQIEDQLWEVEEKLWTLRGNVDLYDVPLKEYTVKLRTHIAGRCADAA